MPPRPYAAAEDLEDSAERYDSRMQAHIASGEVKVRIKRVLPSRSDVGEIQAHVAPSYGVLVAFIKQHAWYGDDAEYNWIMQRKGRKVTSGDVVLAKDERVKRLVEDGDWPTHHDALFSPAPPARAPRAQPPAPAPPPQPTPPDPWAHMPQPSFDLRSYERERERERDDARAEREPRRFRDLRDDRDRDYEDELPPPPRRRHEEPPPRPIEAAPMQPRSSDPTVSRLLDEMSDMRNQMYEVLERSSREQAATQAKFQLLIDRLAAPAVQSVQPAPTPAPVETGPRTLMDDPAISSLASMGAAMTALRTVSGTLGMVDGSVISEMQRKHEAQALKQQIERLNEKLNEVLTKPAADAAASAAAAAAAATAAPGAAPAASSDSGEDGEEKEESAQEKLAKRTTQAGPAVIVEDEDGEIDMVKSVMASIPGALALFGAMQEKKTKAAQEQYELLRKANVEAARQTKLINDYAASLERLNAAGGAMPEPPADEESGSSESSHVESDESVTSLADA